jgi:hypothetical protein
VLTIADAQGIWRSAAGAGTTLSAVVLPDGKLWALMSDASSTRLLKASLAVQSGSLAGSGKNYTLGTSTLDNVALAASVIAKTSLTGNITAAAPAAAQSLSLSCQTRYDTAATLADFTGNWTSPVGSPVVLTWTVSAGVSSDTITGTTGCTYAGSLSLRTESKAVVDAAVNETCADVVKPFAGVALGRDSTGAGVTTSSALLLLTSTGAPDEALAVILAQ